MAKRKIVWSNRARIKLFEILNFYVQRNGSKTYSLKLYSRITRETKLLLKQPDLGITTDIESVRGLIIGDYAVYYEITEEWIIIHTLWDSRQDPTHFTIK